MGPSFIFETVRHFPFQKLFPCSSRKA